MSFIPSVEYGGSNTQRRVSDVFSRLLSDRAVMLVGPIDANQANSIIAQLLHLEADNPGADIQLYINSPGGEVYSGLAIYDVMQSISSKVETICIGEAASAASFLLVAGDRRLITPHSRVLIHQPMGGGKGQALEIKNYTKELYRLYEILISLYIKHTKMTREQIETYLDRDSIFEPDEAIKLGIVDGIVQSRKHKSENGTNTAGSWKKMVDEKIENEMKSNKNSNCKLNDNNSKNEVKDV